MSSSPTLHMPVKSRRNVEKRKWELVRKELMGSSTDPYQKLLLTTWSEALIWGHSWFRQLDILTAKKAYNMHTGYLLQRWRRQSVSTHSDKHAERLAKRHVVPRMRSRHRTCALRLCGFNVMMVTERPHPAAEILSSDKPWMNWVYRELTAYPILAGAGY